VTFVAVAFSKLNFTELIMLRSASLTCLQLCMSLSWAAFVSLE